MKLTLVTLPGDYKKCEIIKNKFSCTDFKGKCLLLLLPFLIVRGFSVLIMQRIMMVCSSLGQICTVHW